jgi:hypothetical protein
MIGADAFSETVHARCTLYLWTALQTHIVIQEYVELDFIANPEVSAVIVEHLIQTIVHMAMHEALKQEVNDLKFQNKSSVEASERLESRMERQGSYIQNLQQYSKVALRKVLKRLEVKRNGRVWIRGLNWGVSLPLQSTSRINEKNQLGWTTHLLD